MLTRFLYLATGWFAISLFATLTGGHRLRQGSPLFSAAWLTCVLLIGDVWGLLTFGIPSEIVSMTIFAFLFGIIWIILLRKWNAFGQVTWAMTILTTLLFIVYSFMVTAFTPLNAVSFVIALDFFLIEALALVMALTHAYESLELFCRIHWGRRFGRIKPIPGYAPMVSLHVPAYNEPPEVVGATLNSLAQLDYPNYEVLVVDNNTPGKEDWIKIRNLCIRLGPRFRFVHLDRWPGYKSGALNFALAHTAPEAEIVGSIDADYMVEPNFLRELVPAFANPKIGFVQAPQDYRDHHRDPFSESAYHGYKYFFEVSMPVRNEHNAIIFCGTMGLIRKTALQQIGGWDEWCITEDAEASLRILKLGYESLYIKHSYGRGLMPYTFESLKKQRFRWCFGGIQILRKHWNSLMPWGRWIDPENRLTLAQRYFYLVGGLQWFTDVLNLLFGIFLTLGAVASIFYGVFSVRPFTGPLLVIPAIFLFLHLWRFLWVLRQALELPARVALRSMYNFFSLGWAVTLACIQGLFRKKGVFLRTPKSRSPSRVLGALRVTQSESLIGLLFLVFGLAAFVVRPGFKTFWLGLLLSWQASLFLAAPYFSLLSVQAAPSQKMRHTDLDRGVAVGEDSAAKWTWATLVAMIALVWIIFQIPLPDRLPIYAKYQPLDVPPQQLFGLPTVPTQISPTPIPSPISSGTPLPTPTIGTTPSPTPSLTPIPSSTPTPVGGINTSTAAVSSTQGCTATPIGFGAPSNTPTPLPPGVPSPIPTPTPIC
ncbi:MAG: glycosyltransferase [Chloroflexi bacterium]|nr:glycosyltransferase [Chloroflexota bacterium]